MQSVFLDIPETYQPIRQQAAELAEAIAPLAVEADRMSTIHTGLLDLIRQSGLMDLMVPAKYGGRFEKIDPYAVCLVREALMRQSANADSLFALQGIGSYAISVGGTEEQQAEWLPKVATGEALAALALTEPGVGSDLKGMATTVTEQGDTLRINGHKSFISNAGAAHFYTVLCKEGDAGLSAVLVPADVKGLRVEPTPEIIAPHVLGEVYFEDVEVPVSARLGAAGQGLTLVLATLACFRISVAAASCGLAQVALEEATRHAKTREQFGRPLARLGPVAGLLADSWAELESTRLLTYRAAELAKDDPAAHLDHSSLAKLAATEACGRIVDRCVQVMGRWGLVTDSRIERCYRQARPMRVYEGASEVLRLGITRRLCAEVD